VSITSSPVDWYAARAAGLVAYMLLTGSVCIGLLLAGRVNARRWPRFALEDVHRFVGLLAGTFLGIHVLTIALDSFEPFGLADLFVPFAASYRPFWTALGVVAIELLAALAVSNRLRRRLGYRTWRRLHYAGFAIWGLATFHGLGAGSDADSIWVFSLYLAAITAVAALAAWRVSRLEGPRVEPASTSGARPLLARPGPGEHNAFFSTTSGEVDQ
jgi:DMSO/TMAO reductase YedYZ heme-binding membrane subunit